MGSVYNTNLNTSFSGADIVATITPVGGKPVVLGTIQTLSYSIYRPTQPVFTLGRINAKGVVRGQRTIAGSLIFTVFDRHVLKSVIESYSFVTSTKDNVVTTAKNKGDIYKFTQDDLVEMSQNMKTDEMPPLTLQFI